MNKSESKYFRTAARMDEVFLALLQQKEFAYITVTEICAAAGVSRSTFYLHYETIGDLLEESLCHIQEQFMLRFQGKAGAVPNIQDCAKQDLVWITPEYLRPYLQFIQDNQQLYRTAMECPAVFQSDKTFQQMFQHLFNPIMDRFSVPAEERHYRITFYLKGIAGIIGEWLETGCQDSVEQMISVIQSCIPAAL